MDHNEFDFIDDLIQPFHQFLKQCKIDVETPLSLAEDDQEGIEEYDQILNLKQNLKPLARELYVRGISKLMATEDNEEAPNEGKIKEAVK